MEETKHYLEQFDWANSAMLTHNQLFDGAILAWHFGIVPAMYMDTLCMTRPINGVDAPASLAALAERYQLGVKGTVVSGALGMRRRDFTAQKLQAYGVYCCNDVELCYGLFNILAADFPEEELQLIDITIRMYTQPVLEIDDGLLVTKAAEIRESKQVMLAALMSKLECVDEEAVRKKLCSNPQFANILEELGVAVPMKVSPRTEKMTFALAKNDEGFMELENNPDPYIQQLCAVRKGTKSTMEESRIERFIGIGSRNKGKLPIPLKYYAAHPGRWGGMDAINLQNLPSRDKAKRTLKNSLRAPVGQLVINGDSSQIEARKLAWWAMQDEVIQLFKNNEDVYCYDASEVYGVVITAENVQERFVGKTMRLGLGYGTGPFKLHHTLKTNPPGAELSIQECKRLVHMWRTKNKRITDLWEAADLALQDMASWPEGKPWYWLGREGLILVTPMGLKLPNNLLIRYPSLRRHNGEWWYDSRKGPQRIWGGVVVENCTQAMARIIVGHQMVLVAKRYQPVLTVHDSVAICAPEKDVTEAEIYMKDCMSITPAWCEGFPVACKITIGKTYGDAS
jgi:DNA polymerase